MRGLTCASYGLVRVLVGRPGGKTNEKIDRWELHECVVKESHLSEFVRDRVLATKYLDCFTANWLVKIYIRLGGINGKSSRHVGLLDWTWLSAQYSPAFPPRKKHFAQAVKRITRFLRGQNGSVQKFKTQSTSCSDDYFACNNFGNLKHFVCII